MNGDRPPLGTNNGVYSQQTSIADALLLDQIALQQQLQDHSDWRARLLAGTNTTGVPSSSTLFPRPQGAWSLPPLPRNGANLATATLQTMNLREDSSRMIAQILHHQRLAASLRDSEKTQMLSKLNGNNDGRIGQELLMGQLSMPSSLALAAAMQSQHMVSELKKRSLDDASSRSARNSSVPGPPTKKRASLDATTATPALPKNNGVVSPAFFPLPNKDQEPKQETLNLISFQRTWGKLEKCRMRTELFRRKLERGEVQLTGVTRSVLYHAKQQQQQTQRQQKQQLQKKKKKQERKETKKKQPTSGEKKKDEEAR
mmetsp:Transcript_39/g.65  ORF Transcript_39/g.65 Transcript_39/m.65 type:complete len:315 (+) Transcript_39:175-1119(+)|eukprot:scaffold38667_cov183-Amphora_coffeaeformis.AAC.3